jgi:hypothetical protein
MFSTQNRLCRRTNRCLPHQTPSLLRILHSLRKNRCVGERRVCLKISVLIWAADQKTCAAFDGRQPGGGQRSLRHYRLHVVTIPTCLPCCFIGKTSQKPVRTLVPTNGIVLGSYSTEMYRKIIRKRVCLLLKLRDTPLSIRGVQLVHLHGMEKP